MTVAPGPDQAKKPPGGVSSTSRAPRTLQPVEALIARRRLGALAVQKGIKGATFMVWSFLLDSTICWQRTEERHFHSYIAAQTGLSKRAVEVAVVALREAGLIGYEGGRPSQNEGRNLPSRFTILHVRDVLDEGVPHHDVAPLPHTDVVPPRQATTLPHDDVAPSRMSMWHPPTQECDTVPHGDVTYRGENSPGEELARENAGVGAQVVRLKPDALPAPSGAAAQSVLDAYCEAMAEAGTPVVDAESLLPGVRAALRAGYSPRSVLIGMGMWESEGFRSPRQIEEWVQKAARQGPEPSHPMSVPDLLAEGRARYTRFLARKAVATPSKAEVRRQRSLAVIRDFIQ